MLLIYIYGRRFGPKAFIRARFRMRITTLQSYTIFIGSTSKQLDQIVLLLIMGGALCSQARALCSQVRGCVLKQGLSLIELSTTLCGWKCTVEVAEMDLRLTFLKPSFSEIHKIRDKCLLGVAVYSWRFQSSISSCSRSTAQTENCYYSDWRVWLKQSSVSHKMHHMKFINEQVLITTFKVLECGERRTVCRSQCMVFLVWLFSWTSIATSFMYLKCIFPLNRLVQVLWLLYAT